VPDALAVLLALGVPDPDDDDVALGELDGLGVDDVLGVPDSV